MVKISVIIPIYNSEHFLRETLQSLSSQSFDDAEFICIDDGSTDDSLNICEAFISSDTRFKLIYGGHGGPSAARNLGIDAATGDYLMFVDSDDQLLPGALSVMYNRIIEDDYDLLIHGADTLIMSGTCPEWVISAITVKDAIVSKFSLEDAFSRVGCRPFLWLHLIRRSIISDNNIYFKEDVHVGEDQIFELNYLKYSRKVIFIHDKLYMYRVNSGNSLMDKYNNPLLKLPDHILLARYVQELYGSSSLHDCKLFLKWSLDLFYWEFIKLLYYDQSKFIDEIVDILIKWRYQELYSTLDILYKTMIDQFTISFKYKDDCNEICVGTMQLCEKLRKNIVDIKSKRSYRLMCKIKNRSSNNKKR